MRVETPPPIKKVNGKWYYVELNRKFWQDDIKRCKLMIIGIIIVGTIYVVAMVTLMITACLQYKP